MTTLSDKSRNNLKIIKNLGVESILSSSSSRDISIQEEFIEVDNINNLENGLFFTFHQSLSDINNMRFVEKDTLINDIDECIQNIYENTKLNSLMEGETELYKIMDDIDTKHNLLKESYYYGSPFYSYYFKFCLLKDYVNYIIENPPCFGFVKYLEDYRRFHDRLNGIYYSSSEESDGDEREIISGCDDNKEE